MVATAERKTKAAKAPAPAKASKPAKPAAKAAPKAAKAPVKAAPKAVKAAPKAVKAGARGKGAAAAPTPEKVPVTVGGQAAHNRHFVIDLNLHAQVLDLAEKINEKSPEAHDRVTLSLVLREGLAEYGAQSKKTDVLETIPAENLADLSALWVSGDTPKVNAYLAALNRAGWPLAMIAKSVVATGHVSAMTRQAVGLRVQKAPENFKASDLPKIPPLGMRRSYNRPEVTPGPVKDVAFRVPDSIYHAAAARAAAEGAVMSSVCEDILRRFVSGKLKIDTRPVLSEK